MPDKAPPVPRQSDLDHQGWLTTAGEGGYQGQRLLDLGCGSGWLCARAVSGGAGLAVGVDMEPPPYRNERWHWHNLNLDTPGWHEDLASYGRFTRILAFDILEHLRSPWDFLASCHQLLDESGSLILTTPNCNSWERWARPQHWSGATDRQHKTLFTPYSLTFLLERSGFRPQIVRAPVRRLTLPGPWQRHWGGQIFSLSGKEPRQDHANEQA